MRTKLVAIVMAALLSMLGHGAATAVTRSTPRSKPPVTPARADPPVHFEANRGQAEDGIAFLARPRGYMAAITPTEARFAVGGGLPDADSEVLLHEGACPAREVVRMQFSGATSSAQPVGTRLLPGKTNYFLGNDPDRWLTDVPHFGAVVTRGLYPGVDLHWRGTRDRHLQYEFHVAPGADPRDIQIDFEGVHGLRLDEDRRLVLATKSGDLIHGQPVLYQDVNGTRTPIEGGFTVSAKRRVGFHVGAYDAELPLVIDPEVTFISLLGGSDSDRSQDIAADSQGASYVFGYTGSTNFPTSSPYQSSKLSGTGFTDLFLTKFNAQGSSLVYSTYIGGNSADQGWGLALDSSGNAYLTGRTASTDFPLASPRQASHGGTSINFDVFVTKVNSSGSALVYSTFHGGSSSEGGWDIAVDSTGAAYVTGYVNGSGLPLQSAFQTSASGTTTAFVSKFSASGGSLIYSSFLGGSSFDWGGGIAVDGSGNAYVCGETNSTNFRTVSPIQATNGGGYDAFIAKVNAAGTALVYSTYLGGALDDYAEGVVVDSGGAAYLCGRAASTNFPTVAAYQSTNRGGGYDAFLTKVNAAGTAWAFSTYLGGTGRDRAYSIALGPGDSVHAVGLTESTNFPTQDTLQGSGGGGFLSEFSASGASLNFSTYLGAGAQAVDVDTRGVVYVAGWTTSPTLATTGAAQTMFAGGETDTFVEKISPPLAPKEPTELVAEAITDLRVELSWTDEAFRETGYEVDRSVDGGAFVRVATLGLDAESWADQTVQGERLYAYRVRAVNDTGESDYTDEAADTTPPRAPSDVTGTTPSNIRIDVAWADNSEAEDGFEIERRGPEIEDVFEPLATVGSDVTEFADTTAEPETRYTYRVRATNADGASVYSEGAATTPPANPLSGEPSSLSDTEVRIRWSDRSGTETGYQIERAAGCLGVGFALLTTAPADSTGYTDASVDPESTYSYRVRAINGIGTSEWSPQICVTTAPSAPVAAAGDPLSPTRLRITWTDRSNAEEGYKLERSAPGDRDFVELAELPPDTMEYVDAAVTQESEYLYRLAAFNDNGTSAWAESPVITTPAILVIRSASIKRPKAKKGKPAKPPTLTATGEFDVGEVGPDLAGAAALILGPGEIAMGALVAKGKGLRYQDDEIRLDLRPSKKGSSRVTFKLRATGALVTALDPDSELTIGYRNGDFLAAGAIELTGDRFKPGKKPFGRLVDPRMHLLGVTVSLGASAKDALKIQAAFDSTAGVPEFAPQVVIRFQELEFTIKSTDFVRKGDRYQTDAKRTGGRKVVLDYAKGIVTIQLKGIEVGEFPKGVAAVLLGIEFGDLRFQDTPVMTSSGKSLKY